jgi:glycosyltransferase involved in cell wall biosynthesis
LHIPGGGFHFLSAASRDQSILDENNTQITKPPRGLRIAMMIESDGPGGAEMMVFRLAEELRRRGHTVIPVGPRNGTGWMGRMFRAVGVSQETFWLKRPIDPTCVTRLASLFRHHAVDVVHSHEFTMGVYGSAAASRVGVPHALTMHGGFTATKTLRRRIALRWAMRQSGANVAVSSATRKEFANNLGLRENAFAVIHNGVPSKVGNADNVRREFGCVEDELVILAVGNLERNKNHRMLLEALTQLQQTGLTVPWRLIIAAGRGGDEHDYLRDYVEAQRLGDHVHIMLGRDDIADLHALADIFVMPSLWEGLPMALLEAMVAGKAILASATAGIPEAIVNGQEGILVPPGDLEALATGLRTLLTDPCRRRELGAAALARGQREFTVEVMADRYLAVYSQLLDSQS